MNAQSAIAVTKTSELSQLICGWGVVPLSYRLLVNYAKLDFFTEKNMRTEIPEKTTLLALTIAAFFATGANGGSCQNGAKIGNSGASDTAAGASTDALANGGAADTMNSTSGTDAGVSDTQDPSGGDTTDDDSSAPDGTADSGALADSSGRADTEDGGGIGTCPETPSGSQSCEWIATTEKYDRDRSTDWDIVVTRHFDAQDRLVRKEKQGLDSNYDDAVTTFKYDKCGRKIRVETDQGADGSIDEVKTFSYSGGTNPTTIELQTDNDPTPEVRTKKSYDNRGRVVRKKVDGADERNKDVDGVFELTVWNKYNQNGDITEKEKDMDLDGTVDWRRTWSYDSQGRVTRGTTNATVGTAEKVVRTYSYSPGERIKLKDGENDGSIDDKVVTVIDSKNRAEKITTFTKQRGSWTKVTRNEWTYGTWTSDTREQHVKRYGVRPPGFGNFDGKVDSQYKATEKCK